MEIKEMIKMINPQGWKIDKVKGNKIIIYGNKRNHYPTRLGQCWKPDWKDDDEIKYCIERVENCITKQTYKTIATVLSF